MKIRRSFLEPKNDSFSAPSIPNIEVSSASYTEPVCPLDKHRSILDAEPPQVAKDDVATKPVSPPDSSLLCSESQPVANFTFLMKKFGETELSLQQHESSLLQQAPPHQDSAETIPFNCEKMEKTSKLQITEKQDPRANLDISPEGLLFYDMKRADYLAPTPPGSDYEELSINATSPTGINSNSVSSPDILSPPLSIGSGLEFPNSPLLPQYHPNQSPKSPAQSHQSPNQELNGSPSSISLGRHLSSSSPLSTMSSSPIPADLIPTSPLPEELHQNLATSDFGLKYQDTMTASPMDVDFPSTVPDSISSSPIEVDYSSQGSLAASPIGGNFTAQQSDTINAPSINVNYPLQHQEAITTSTAEVDYPVQHLDTIATSPAEVEYPGRPQDTLPLISKDLESIQPEQSMSGQSNQMAINEVKCSYTNYSSACVQSFSDTFSVFESKDTDFKYSKSNEFLLNEALSCLSGSTASTSPLTASDGMPATAKVIKEEPSCKQCAQVACQCPEPGSKEDSHSTPDDNHEEKSETKIVSSKLPEDIPTLASLAKSSPKLSTWRQTRIVSEKLEQHLWIWRCACKKSGKRISKSLLQARAKWAFRKAGILEFKASDGWYWKWLAKWRRKGEEIGIKEQGQLTQQELKIIPYGANQRSQIKSELPVVGAGGAEICECVVDEDIQPSSNKRPILTESARGQPPCKAIKKDTNQSSSDFSRFIPLDKPEECGPASEESFPNKIVPVRDILPLTLSGNEILLAPHPTDSSLPISPIFIKTTIPTAATQDTANDLSEYSSVLLEGFDEFPMLSSDLLNLDSLCNWQGEIEDIDPDTLVRSLSNDSDQADSVRKEDKTNPLMKGEDKNLPNDSDRNAGNPLKATRIKTEESDLEDSNISLVSSGEVCGANCKKLKQGCGGDRSPLYIDPEEKGAKSNLTTIALYKKRGEESLNKFKEEVRKFAVDHTFKETAKRFGIHHSTVSGWVKESEKLDKSAHLESFFKERGDEKFINWLREYRDADQPVTLNAVKKKVSDILLEYSTHEIEKTCKWFLLWHNRREERLYVEGMEDEDIKKETQNLAYPPAFKLEVALFAKKHSQYAAAKIFNVARRRIFDWMRQIPKLEELIAKGHMKKMTGRGPKNRDIDQALYTWYCDRKARGNRPKSCHVQSKARELYLTYGYRDMKCSYGWFKRWSQRFQIQLRYSYDDEILEWIMSRFDENMSVNAQELQTYGLSLIQKEDPNFKASSGWALRFCKRHKEFMSSDGSFPSKLPHHLDSRVKTFRRVLHQLQQEKGFPRSCIGCVDELPIHFNNILEKRPGCVLKHSGIDTADVSVILSILADGTLLSPLVLFKKDGVEDEKTKELDLYMKGSTLVLENQSTVTETEFLVWLEKVWFRNVRTPNFLLADSFHVHTAELTKKLVLKKDSVLAIIPRACSSKLQPLHQGIKLRFRNYIEECFLNSVKSSIGRGEGKPNPSRDTVISWVDQAYTRINLDKEEILRSFKRADIFQ